ncbi:MAG: DUF4861 family protein, partial [Chitinophagaceae bacterium]|nr:DUF4861 family protein [Chitinophagaceae bacterium]
SNPIKVNREEVVAIPWKNVLSVYPGIDTANFIIINPKTKQQAIYQLEYRGTKEIQNLLIQVTVAAEIQLQLQKGKPEKFVSKTYSRYVPERKDDFAWENDKIAFRMYGKALEGTKENAYGTDVWVKRTDKLVINERYKRAEYHIDHGDGMDYYHVGFSLGAGNMAPYKNDTIWYSKNYRTWKVLDNGPLRSTFQLTFEEWNVSSEKVKVIKTISLDAGSQMNRVEATYQFDHSSNLQVAAGIIKRKEPGVIWLNENNGVMGYWEPTHKTNGTTGVGCVFIQPIQVMMSNKEHLLTVLETKSNNPLIYYTGAAWDRAGIITSSEKWFEYLTFYKQRLENPLKVFIHK